MNSQKKKMSQENFQITLKVMFILMKQIGIFQKHFIFGISSNHNIIYY